MKKPLTDSQRKTFEFIAHYIEQHGFAPKMDEIAQGIHIRSKGTVHRYIQALVEAGRIHVHPKVSRGIEIIHPSSALELPLLGTIAAGRPIEAIPEEERLNITDWIPNEDGLYALKVRGDSMIEAGILEGDTVICRSTQEALAHQVAVVLVDQSEATLKYCRFNTNGTITLIPANSALQPQTYQTSRVCIQGVVVSQLRRYS